MMIQLDPLGNSETPSSHTPYQKSVRWFSPFEGGSNNSHLDIFMTQKAYIRICAHAGSDIDNEVGGWLIGKWRKDSIKDRVFIVVEIVLPAVYTRSGNTYLTFTQESQLEMHGFLEKHYPGKDIVGWYHTHPRMGIFMSRYDTWLHENFFQKPWQVALVIEPVSTIGGFFIHDGIGDMESSNYVGFYELLREDKQSVVHWKNLSKEEPFLDGGNLDE
jgi:proteasome lid subunit RPN8/RPN11